MEREVIGSELPISAVLCPRGQAQGVLCKPVVVLVEKQPSFWPMRKEDRVQDNYSCRKEGTDSWKGRAREGVPKFYLFISLAGSWTTQTLNRHKASQLEARV